MITTSRVSLATIATLLIAAAVPAEEDKNQHLPMPNPARDHDQFVLWQQAARGKLLEMLGIPARRVPLEAEARGEFETDGVVVEKWIFTLEPGSKTPAIVYRPKDAPVDKLPAVVLTYGHGASKSHPSYQYIGQVLAKMNVICLAIDPIGEEERHKERRTGTRAHDAKDVDKAAWDAGRPVLGKLVFDTMRGVDFLLTREDVDPKRIGVAGNSLGGYVAFWIAALDPRLRCAIASGSKTIDSGGKLCTRTPQENMRHILQWHEFLALAAPHCSVLFANGDADLIIDRGDGASWRATDAAVGKAKLVFRTLGNEDGITTWYEKGGGHRPYPAHPEALAWLVKQMAPPGWTPEKARELPRINFGEFAAANSVQFEQLYGTSLHLKGATMAGLDIEYLPPKKLRVLQDEEVGSPEFTIEGWLSQIQDTKSSCQARPTVGSLQELLDLHAIQQVKPWRTHQTSSGLIDRFEDYGNFVREEPEGHYVLLDVKGRGCVDRFWCVYKKGRPQEANIDLLVYLDGEQEPTIKMDMNDLFGGKRAPFVAPLVGRCGFEDRQSSFSYVPIGFRKSCKIVAVPRELEQLGWRDRDGKKQSHFVFFHQLTYRLCPPDVSVEVFNWELDEQESRALAAVQSIWAMPGKSPWPPSDPALMKTHNTRVELAEKSRAILLDHAGSGTLRQMRLRIKAGDNSPELRLLLAESLWLDMTWGGAEKPQVSAPLGAFFAAPDSAQDIRGLWLGCSDGEYYCHLPMPFRHHAKVAVRPTKPIGEKVAIEATFDWNATPPHHEDALFHASRYDISNAPKGENLVLLDVSGRGHVVGVIADRPGNVESDDSWYIDGETKPSILGTGTEDFFNFAWGLGDLQALPMHGVRVPFGPPDKRGQRTDSGVCYRFHLPAAFPFRNSLKLTWEHGSGNRDDGRYSGITYYYLLPASVKREGIIRVACVGDSTTEGTRIADPKRDGYPAVLGRLLGGSYEVRNFGKGGSKVMNVGKRPYVTTTEFKDAIAFRPHIVIIQLGTNDSKPEYWKHKDRFDDDLNALIDHFAALPTKPNIWLCTPAWVAKSISGGITEEVVGGQVVPAVRAIAKARNLPLIDNYNALKHKPEWSADGIHPNEAGAKALAKSIYDELLLEQGGRK